MQEVRIDWGIRSGLGSSMDTSTSAGDLRDSRALPRVPGALEVSAGYLRDDHAGDSERFPDLMGLPVRTDSRTGTPVDFVQGRCCVIM